MPILPAGLGTWGSVSISGVDGWTAPAWSPTLSRFVAVRFTNIETPGTDDIAYSADGIAWTLVSTGLLTRKWLAVEWVPFLSAYVALAVGFGGTITNAVATSADGISWVPRTAVDTPCWNLAASGAKVVCVSSNDNTVLTSSNGTSWTSEATTGGPVSWGKIAYSADLNVFVATGYDANNDIAIYSSVNGTAWTLRYSHGAGTDAGIVWDATLAKFVVVIDDGSYATSTNGTSWTDGAFTGAALAFPALDVATAGGFFVALAAPSVPDVITSVDGTTWTLQSNVLPGIEACGTIRWGAGVNRFVTGGADYLIGNETYYATYSVNPTVTGLDHLEGMEVSVVADGVVIASPNNPLYDPITVTGGEIELPVGTYTSVTVGLPYTTDIQTLDIDAVSTTVKERGLNIGGVIAWIEETGSFYAGPVVPSGNTLTGLERYTPQNDQGYDVTGPVTGVAEVTLQSTYNNSGRVLIRQVDPVPLTILSIAPTGFLNGGR